MISLNSLLCVISDNCELFRCNKCTRYHVVIHPSPLLIILVVFRLAMCVICIHYQKISNHSIQTHTHLTQI
ncbi:hypothetical protein VNO80_19367 [Phaseolus coccineus]|uniref:Uncharacterized protein n=1 Tax=Phaseolus coccineus TaxID=3886 RepID=A0AAN9R4P6_PHACN